MTQIIPQSSNTVRTDEPTYRTAMQIGQVMRGGVVGRVLASKSPKVSAGDLVQAMTGWREVAVCNEDEFRPSFPLPAHARVTDLLGVFWATGFAAYFGMTKHADVRAGDTVVVSGAAGSTGSIAGQIARIQGANRVVGIAGTPEKVRWLEDELGFDVALNYRDADFAERFREATPDLIDVYWDNGEFIHFLKRRTMSESRSLWPMGLVPVLELVICFGVGDEMLDLALARANLISRYVMCGGISHYNTPPYTWAESKSLRSHRELDELEPA